jgi:hypothetical protein
MASTPKVLTGALAIIKYRGRAIGHMRGITINENITRSNVYQLGSILPLETPATQWSGTITCDFYEINWKRSGIPQATVRDVQNNTEYENNIVLDYDGIQIDVYKKEQDVINPETRKVTPKETPYAVIRRAFLTTESTNTNEGAVAGRNQSFNYLDPVIQPN